MWQRFNVVCCTSQEQFRREPRAVTRSGQSKGGDRHEKDDRHRLDDRSRYVLGWSNAAKLDALKTKARVLEARLGQIGAQIGAVQTQQQTVQHRLSALDKLVEFHDYRELDWPSLALDVQRVQDELTRLQESSDLLQTLTQRLAALEGQLEDTEGKLATQRGQTELLATAADTDAAVAAQLAALQTEISAGQPLTVESCDARERDVRDALQKSIDTEASRANRLLEKIIAAMRAFSTSIATR